MSAEIDQKMAEEFAKNQLELQTANRAYSSMANTISGLAAKQAALQAKLLERVGANVRTKIYLVDEKTRVVTVDFDRKNVVLTAVEKV